MERGSFRKTLPWLLLFWSLLFFGGVLLHSRVNPTPDHPPSTVNREMYRQFDSSGDLHTRLTLTITEVRDTAGEIIMPGQRSTIISPGDTVSLFLEMDRNGHVASFSITDPWSDEVISTSNPTEVGNLIATGATLTLSVPPDAAPNGTIQIPWQAEAWVTERAEATGTIPVPRQDEAYLIESAETTGSEYVITRWFYLIKRIPLSGELELPLSSQQARSAWLEMRVNALGPTFLRFAGMALCILALIVVLRRRLLTLVSAFAFFAGFVWIYVVDVASEGPPGRIYLLLALGIALGGVAVAVCQVRRFHAETIKELFWPGNGVG